MQGAILTNMYLPLRKVTHFGQCDHTNIFDHGSNCD